MQQKYEVYISKQAQTQLNRILDYIEYELSEPATAKKLFFKIKQKILELESFPEKFSKIKSKCILEENVRKCNINQYIIVYRVNKKLKKVDVPYIFYAKQNWMKQI